MITNHYYHLLLITIIIAIKAINSLSLSHAPSPICQDCRQAVARKGLADLAGPSENASQVLCKSDLRQS